MGTVFKVGDRVRVNDSMYGSPYDNNVATIVEVEYGGREYVAQFDANPDRVWFVYLNELELVTNDPES